jgi:hypothetical protein
MNGKLVSFICILILVSRCSTELNPNVTNIPDIPTPTFQKSYLDFWKATANFGTFTFVLNLSTWMGVVGKFDFSNGFSCGTSKVSGISYEVFDINVAFPLPKFISKRDPPATVTFPVGDAGFTVSPFWIATTGPVIEEWIPVLTMTLIGTFDSDTKVSGEYTAYFVSNPGSMELQSIPCTRPFTATLISP